MKNNRCFKLTALLFLAMIMVFSTFSVLAEEGNDGADAQIGPVGNLVLEARPLDSTFVKKADILMDGKTVIAPDKVTDPNHSYVLKLEVSEPVGASDAKEMLPENTDLVTMSYALPNVAISDSANQDVSWSYLNGAVTFKWVNGKKTSFSAEIPLVPNYPTENNISGTYVLVSGTNAVLGAKEYKDGSRGKLKSYPFNMAGDKIVPLTAENTSWTISRVSGNYYTIKSANDGRYLHIQKKGANGYADNSLYLEAASDETAQKFEMIELNGGYYAFKYDGHALNNSGNNVYNGFASYGYANGGNNEKFKLYPLSSVQQEPTHNLSGTWVIQSISRILSNESKQAGKLFAIGYNTAADNDSILILNDNLKTWTFTNVARDWYTISSEGKYLNIANGSVSVSDQPQNLMIRSDDNFATIIISNGEFDAKGTTYCLRNQNNNDNFESVTIGTGANTDTSKTMTLISEERIAKSSEVISGSWAIVTENSGAVLLNQLNNGKLASLPYSRTENGVFSIGAEIPAWTFNQVDGGWYTIQTQEGKYLSINGNTLSLSDSETKVFIQEYNGKIRITNGAQYALKNADGKPANGYNIYDKGKAKDANEWHTLSRIDQDAANMNLIIFDRNGGTAASVPDAAMGKAGDTMVLPAMEATKDGKAFMGWAEVQNFFAINPKTKQTYNDLYRPGETYTFGAGTKTLYAVYNSEANKKVQFGIRLDGVIQDEPNDYDKGAYKGHFWADGILKESRWAIDIDSTKQVNGYYVVNDVTACLNRVPSVEEISQALKKEGNIDFDPETQYIHYYVLKKTPGGDWHVDGVIRNKANIEVSYNVNVPVNEKQAIANMPGSYQVAPGTEIIVGTPKNSATVMTPRREGYVFNGWNTKADGSGDSYLEASYIRLRQNLNLYAQWVKSDEGQLIIKIDSDWPAGKPAYEGTEITLTAKLTGFEGKEYTLQWQYSTDLENWIDEPGANGITHTYTMNETTANYTWRVIARNVR